MLMYKIDHLTNLNDLMPGDRVRVNHTDCEAGEDTRRRLYIERSDVNPNLVIYYCHNCQDGGRHSEQSYQKYRDDRHKPTPPNKVVIQETITEPMGMVFDMSQWPTAAVAWATVNGVTPANAGLASIGYDPNDHRIYLPRYDRLWWPSSRTHALVGYQKRLIEGRGPKYTTVQLNNDAENYTLIMVNDYAVDEITHWVVVEDYVSGIHIADAIYAKFKSHNKWGIAVNYGTKVNTHMLYSLQNAKRMFVWLDNDSQHVRNQAKHIAQTGSLFGIGDYILVENVDDPKNHEPSKLREELGIGG